MCYLYELELATLTQKGSRKILFLLCNKTAVVSNFMRTQHGF